MKIFTKKHIVIALIAVVIVGVGMWRLKTPAAPTYEFTMAQRGDIVQLVSVTGKVKPTENVDLAFEISGKVAKVDAQVSDHVKKGDLLAELDSTSLRAQSAEARGAFAAAQAKLSEMQAGTRPEEIAVAQTTLDNAKVATQDARTNLDNVQNKANADLQDDYNSALAAAVKSVSIATNSLYVLTDLQNTYFSNFDQQATHVADAKANAALALLGALDAGRASKDYLSTLSGGAKGSVLAASANPMYANIDKALTDLSAALDAVKNALDAVPVLAQFSSTDATNLNTERNNISAEIITTSGKQQAIDVQKALNQSSIATAQAGVNTATNAEAAAQANLTLKQAGYTKEQIAAQEAAVAQASAHVDTVNAQLAETALRAPMDGVVTAQNAKEGQIATAGAPVVSLISEAQFEMEANVAEADIANVKIGDEASVTLDAYGSDVVFQATVSAIDPAATVIEGVPTYKVTLQFAQKDDRVKSGMTANIDIVAGARTTVIVIPQRAVATDQQGKKTVRVLLANQTVSTVPVEVGLKGSDGNIEIVSGVNEGDRVITSPIQ